MCNDDPNHFCLPDALAEALDFAAASLNQSRDDVVRQAVAEYLEDFADVSTAQERLHDAADPVLDWAAVRPEFTGTE